MSLFSILNNDSSSTSSTSSLTQLLQTLQTQSSTSSTTSTSSSSQSGVSISVEAQRTANAEEDASKTAEELANEMRSMFDEAGKDSADLTTLSGRALATVALNESGQFSRSEIAAAKLELRTRDRQDAVSMFAEGTLTSASLATYTNDLLAARESMSAEERQLRETNPDLR